MYVEVDSERWSLKSDLCEGCYGYAYLFGMLNRPLQYAFFLGAVRRRACNRLGAHASDNQRSDNCQISLSTCVRNGLRLFVSNSMQFLSLLSWHPVTKLPFKKFWRLLSYISMLVWGVNMFFQWELSLLSPTGALSHILTDTLDLGKLEAGLAEILRERFDLCELMVNSIKIFEPVVISKRLSLKAKVAFAWPNACFTISFPCFYFYKPIWQF